MIRATVLIRGFFGSLTGRIMILLTAGMLIAAIAALLVSQQAQRHYYQRLRLENVVASATDIVGRLERDPSGTARLLEDDRILGARPAPVDARLTVPDEALTSLLRSRLGARAAPAGQWQPAEACFPARRFDFRVRANGLINEPHPDCWLIRFRDMSGETRLIDIALPRLVVSPDTAIDPIYLTLIFLASAVLSILTAQVTTAPLRRLTRAARAFSLSVDPDPIPETGPREVRTAIATFNLMQRRVSAGFRERTQILAAVSHDLQTPLTRLRLRLEQVQDDILRERLISDLAGTQALVREGLELARSSESREPWSIVDIDSLLASLAEDAAEFGASVEFVRGCGKNIRTKPDGLTRCVTNLIDNAVKYGGGAEIACSFDRGDLEIAVRDRGEGLAEDMLEKMFEPFVRGEISRSRTTGGTGIGLTIARAQAKLLGGEVNLANHPEGGLVAKLSITLI